MAISEAITWYINIFQMPVITFSTVFPTGHPRAGEPTYFVEKILKALGDAEYMLEENINTHEPKFHTIRGGNRWTPGMTFSPRIWSGKPYRSKQIQFAPDIEIKKVWEISFHMGEKEMMFTLNGNSWPIDYRKGIHANFKITNMAQNDGLELDDFMSWFKYPEFFNGQIICWNEKIDY